MSKTEIPSIRFRGFDDAWEQRKLGDCFSERVENMPDGELISVTINDGIKKFSELGRHDNSNDDKSKYKKVCVGDIAYNSMRMWQGASGYSPYEGIVSPAYTVLSPNAGVLSKCIAYQFKLPQMIHTFQINSQGITSDNWNLKYPALSEIEIYISQRVAEQKQIAEFFTSIDRLITLHQRKFEKLTNVKKSMLEKMFPQNGSSYPEIRFKGFTDPWEQRKLGEVATFINGRAYSQPELLSSGKYKVLRVGNFYTNDSWYYSDLELGEKYYADYGDLLYTWSATFGPHIWLGDRVIYHYHIWKINLSDQLEKQFAVQLLEQDRANILSSKNGSTMVHITKEGMEQKDVIIPPSTKEQQEIGAFFLQLDNLITLHQRELEKLQNIKKSMLEKMFV